MMIAINILLAVLSLTATLAAFGGETWKRGDEHLNKRITKRGYVSLFCLFSAFSLGTYKEVKINEQKAAAAEELKILKTALDTASITVQRSTGEITGKVEEFKNTNCSGLEDAFRLAINIPREYDDNVVNLDGEEKVRIEGRKSNPMELYWGDKFEVTFVEGSGFTGKVGDLASIKLSVDGREYNLHPGNGNLFYHGYVRIYGGNPNPMTGYIINPLRLSRVKIKIFVSSTDASRGQQEFKRIVLNGQCSEFAKRIYKVVKADAVRLRAQANENSQIRSTLTKGSFVKTIQVLESWSEIITPENRQGWIKTEHLTLIN